MHLLILVHYGIAVECPWPLNTDIWPVGHFFFARVWGETADSVLPVVFFGNVHVCTLLAHSLYSDYSNLLTIFKCFLMHTAVSWAAIELTHYTKSMLLHCLIHISFFEIYWETPSSLLLTYLLLQKIMFDGIDGDVVYKWKHLDWCKVHCPSILCHWLIFPPSPWILIEATCDLALHSECHGEMFDQGGVADGFLRNDAICCRIGQKFAHNAKQTTMSQTAIVPH